MVDIIQNMGANGTTGASSYTYIRYAADASGTGLSATPGVGLDYIAIKNTNTEIPSPSASDFTGLWFNWKGAAGGAVNTVLHGTVDPTTEGDDDDFYVNTTTSTFFGPKAGGVWPGGVSMIGTAGPPGDDGINGTNGTNGANGATILFGDGAPLNGTGNNGDSYVDTTNHVFYYNKTSGTWPNSFSMLGPTGATGPSGNTILYGTAAPNSGTGSNGDSYYDTTNKIFYANKAGGVWPAGTSLVGPTGASGSNGTNGNTIIYGTSAPSNGTGNNGDTFIDTTNKVAYFNKSGGVWPAGASLVGSTGATGPAGPTGSAGAQGDRAGYPQDFSNTTTMADPGVNQIRFNAGSTGATTQIAQSVTMVGGASIAALLATARVNDVWRVLSNANGDTTFCVFKINGKTNNTTWYRWDVTFIAGSLPSNAERLSFDLLYGGVALDNDGNLVDALGNVVSGVNSGTYSAIPAAVDSSKEYYLATDYGPNGLLYFVPNGGTAWVLPFEQPVYDGLVGKKIIQPNAAITWTASNSGGKVRLTSSGAHGLTTSPAVGASLVVASGTNWTVNSLHDIVTVVSTTVIDTNTTWASQGVPTIGAANTEIELFSVALPPLGPNSVVIIEQVSVYSSSTNAKRTRLYLDSAELNAVNNITTNGVLLTAEFKFRNQNATNSQKMMSAQTNNSGVGIMTGAQVATSIETNVSKNLRFTVQPATANEMIGLDSIRVAVRN